MPYHIEEDHPDCTGFAVVKDDDDTLMGCHDTREDAEAQVAALYATEADEEKKETMLKKTYTVSEFKALPDRDGKTGRFEALVAVFGNVDYQGDRVLKGAFTKSLQRWKGSGDPFPIIWSHDWGNPLAHIGKADPADMEETDSGLKIVGEIDLDSEFAAQVYRLMKERRVKEFSFGYDVVEERPGDDGANDLAEVDVIEAGPTLKGANPRTELLGVKAALEAGARAEREHRQLTPAEQKAVDLALEFGEEGEKIAAALLRAAETGKSVYAPLPGSDEAHRDELRAAVGAWFGDTFEEDADSWVDIVGTFPDRVVVAVYRDAGQNPEYLEFDYERADDHVQLGEPASVEVEVTVVRAAAEDDEDETDRDGPRATARGTKRGRVLSAKSEALVRQIADAAEKLLAQVQRDNPEEPEKARDPEVLEYEARLAELEL